MIKLQQVRDDTLSLTDLVRLARTDLNLTITRQTVSRILWDFDMVSYIAPRKPRITPTQRRTRVAWCYEHLSLSVNDWSNVAFMDESNYEILNRKNRIYTRRFRYDPTRFERSQQRVHRGRGIGIWLYVTCHVLGPLLIYDGRLNSSIYIDLIEKYLPTIFKKFSLEQSHKILYQQDNAGPHVLYMTQEYLKKKGIIQLKRPANSPDINIIENIWSIVDNKLLKLNKQNTDDLKTALQTVWTDISNDIIKKIFGSLPGRLRQVINRRGFSCRS